MKKIGLVFLLVFLLGCVLVGCGCEHEWKEATCLLPKMCALCGEMEGEVLPHNWVDASCTQAKHCTICEMTEGLPLGHDWQEASCEKAKKCNVCQNTEGKPLGHVWVDATCTTLRMCSVCGKESGTSKPHYIQEWTKTKMGTCTEKGEITGTCSQCGEQIIKETDDFAHREGAWKIIIEATDTSAGTKTKSCTICGATLHTKTYSLTWEEKMAYYKKSCTQYSYNQVARDPDSYVGERVVFRGTVIQSMENGSKYTLRVKVGWDQILYVSYTKASGQPRILENDYITLYGTFAGTVTYETIFGASVTIPAMLAEYADY